MKQATFYMKQNIIYIYIVVLARPPQASNINYRVLLHFQEKLSINKIEFWCELTIATTYLEKCGSLFWSKIYLDVQVRGEGSRFRYQVDVQKRDFDLWSIPQVNGHRDNYGHQRQRIQAISQEQFLLQEKFCSRILQQVCQSYDQKLYF